MSDCQYVLEKKRSFEITENIIKRMNAGVYVYDCESFEESDILTFEHKRLIRTYADIYSEELEYQKLNLDGQFADDLDENYNEFVYEYMFFDRYVPLYGANPIPMYSSNNFPKYSYKGDFYWLINKRSDFFSCIFNIQHYKNTGLTIREIEDLGEAQIELIIDYATTFYDCIKQRIGFKINLDLYIQRLQNKHLVEPAYRIKIERILLKAKKLRNKII